jgi:hypothetical protein
VTDLDKLSPGKTITVKIITDDPDAFERILDYNPGSKTLVVEFYKHMSNAELRDFLVTHSDIHFAMGTSCLEGASLGIPSILMDLSDKELPDQYLYKWLYEAENFSLGSIIRRDQQKFTGKAINTILEEFSVIKHRDELSRRCFEYVNKNHSIGNTASLFLQTANDTKLRLRDIKRYIIYYSKLHLLFKKGINLAKSMRSKNS